MPTIRLLLPLLLLLAACSSDGDDDDTSLRIHGAQDTPRAVQGDAEDNRIYITDASGITGVDGQQGGDTLIIERSRIDGDIVGGDGDDSFLIRGGIITGNLSGGDGADFFNLNEGGVLIGNLSGGGGDDEIRLGGQVEIIGEIDTGTGSDTLIITGAYVRGAVSGGEDDDEFSIQTPYLSAYVDMGEGSDRLGIFTGRFNQYHGGARNSNTDDGNLWGGQSIDRFSLLGGVITNSIIGSDEDADTIIILGGEVQGGIQSGDGADDLEDIETLPEDAGSLLDREFNGEGNFISEDADAIILLGGSVAGGITGRDGTQLIMLGRVQGDNLVGTASVSGNITGGADNDFIQLLSGEIDSTTSISGGAGDDWIEIRGDFSFDAYNGGSGGDDGNIYGGAGADTFILNGGTITGDITGDDEVDTITLDDGTFGTFDENDDYESGGNIDGGDGDDEITVRFGIFASYHGGSSCTDSAEAGCINGGPGEDRFTLDGAEIMGDIVGANNAEADHIILIDGEVEGRVNLRGGNDVFELGEAGASSGAEITGDVSGGAGRDTFRLYAGTLDFISGGDGGDTFYIYADARHEEDDDGEDIIFTGDCNTGTNGNQWICGGNGDDAIIYDDGIDPLERGTNEPSILSVENECEIPSGEEDCTPESASLAISGIEQVALSPRLALWQGLIPAMQDLAHALTEDFTSDSKTDAVPVAVRHQVLAQPIHARLKLGEAQGISLTTQKTTFSQQRVGAELADGFSLHGGMHIAHGRMGSASLMMGLEAYGAETGLRYHQGGLSLAANMVATHFLFSPEHAGYAGADNFSGQQMSASLNVAQAFRWLAPQAQLTWHETHLPFDISRGFTAQAGIALMAGEHRAAIALHHAEGEESAIGGFIRHQPGGTFLSLDWQGNFVAGDDFTLGGSAGWRAPLNHELDTADAHLHGALTMRWKF